MLIIAIDTSQPKGSVTLAAERSGSLQVLQTVAVEGGTFSAQLIPAVASLLKEHGREPLELAGICASIGPGSFTGLRIGLAAVKGLAEVLQVPIAAVSMLEALAVLSPTHGRLITIMDARRSEFYVGEYNKNEAEVSRLSEKLCTLAEVLAMAEGPRAKVITADEHVVGSMQSTGIEIVRVAAPGSVEVARIGWRKLRNGDTTTVEALDANYLRRDEALFFKHSGMKNEDPAGKQG
jgi:tRNA threonylcarbamoyladenosine biosynthesis protein TsaB